MAQIRVDHLDFDPLKEDFLTFLKSRQPANNALTDFDFEGSAIQTVVDMMCYWLHYQMLYYNLSLNESFLDSASRRDSVVSLAKSLGYTPRSASCAYAEVDLVFSLPPGSNVAVNSLPASFPLPADSRFTTIVGTETYAFYNQSAQTANRSATGSYTFSGLELTGGTPVETTAVKSEGTRFFINNVDADLDTLTVNVQDSQTSSEYTRAASVVEVGVNSPVYFIRQIDGGIYEVEFGDGVVGRQVANGNVVHIKYYVSHLDAVNGVRRFSYDGILPHQGQIAAVAPGTAAAGGGERETLESIRFNAPRHYASQNRGVTARDYRTLVLRNFAAAQSVNVWGGEENNPPVYGKVFIAVRKADGSAVTSADRTAISGILENRRLVGVFPEVVDAEVLGITLNITVGYDANATVRPANEILSVAQTAIENYNRISLRQFDGVFRFSELNRTILEAESSIRTADVNVVLHKEFTPVAPAAAVDYRIFFNNPLKAGTLSSGTFNTAGRTGATLRDAGGRLFIGDDEAGMIDYAAGIVDLHTISITSSDVIRVNVEPAKNDIFSVRNQVAEIDEINLTVTGV